MVSTVQQLTSPHRVRPSAVQSSLRNFWTWLGPIPNCSGPGLNWPGLLWTSPFGPNRPYYAWSYWSTETTNTLIYIDSSCHSKVSMHILSLTTCLLPLTSYQCNLLSHWIDWWTIAHLQSATYHPRLITRYSSLTTRHWPLPARYSLLTTLIYWVTEQTHKQLLTSHRQSPLCTTYLLPFRISLPHLVD